MKTIDPERRLQSAGRNECFVKRVPPLVNDERFTSLLLSSSFLSFLYPNSYVLIFNTGVENIAKDFIASTVTSNVKHRAEAYRTVCECMCAYVCERACVCVRFCMCACLRVYMCVRVCMCGYVSACAGARVRISECVCVYVTLLKPVLKQEYIIKSRTSPSSAHSITVYGSLRALQAKNKEHHSGENVHIPDERNMLGSCKHEQANSNKLLGG